MCLGEAFQFTLFVPGLPRWHEFMLISVMSHVTYYLNGAQRLRVNIRQKMFISKVIKTNSGGKSGLDFFFRLLSALERQGERDKKN